MRTLLTALICLFLFTTPVVAGDFDEEAAAALLRDLSDAVDLDEGVAAANAGDYQKAIRLWTPLAEQGYAPAQSNLGVKYAKGEGVPQNDVHAYAWLSIAVAQGYEDARGYKGISEDKMTREQIAEAQKLPSEYWEKYVALL